MDRGSGITTKQIQNAPEGAVFVWVNGHTDYPKSLARELGRDDLEIVSPCWLESSAFRGRKLAGIIIDHATNLTSRQWDELHIIRAYMMTHNT